MSKKSTSLWGLQTFNGLGKWQMLYHKFDYMANAISQILLQVLGTIMFWRYKTILFQSHLLVSTRCPTQRHILFLKKPLLCMKTSWQFKNMRRESSSHNHMCLSFNPFLLVSCFRCKGNQLKFQFIFCRLSNGLFQKV